MAKMLPLGPLHVAQILVGLQCIKKVLGRESPFKHNNNNTREAMTRFTQAQQSH